MNNRLPPPKTEQQDEIIDSDGENIDGMIGDFDTTVNAKTVQRGRKGQGTTTRNASARAKTTRASAASRAPRARASRSRAGSTAQVP